ncbi:rhodanese-like domain-containing protein [Pedobacter arcticus]|uniref:rhodanese-like domain-containing protein n=1 Tax=Pedobacter arcticus TaxID=752140 RepID=UPI0002EFE214|nr:rhodanese-like domain-containing protein [Pedobacter arcticus]
MKSVLFIFVTLLFTGFTVKAQTAKSNVILASKIFSDSLQNNPALVLLDVRTPEEFSEGHLKNALNYDFKSADFKAKIVELDKAKTYYLYCKSGKRSAAATAEMRSNGFKSIYELDGGITKWVADGMQTVKEIGKH